MGRYCALTNGTGRPETRPCDWKDKRLEKGSRRSSHWASWTSCPPRFACRSLSERSVYRWGCRRSSVQILANCSCSSMMPAPDWQPAVGCTVCNSLIMSCTLVDCCIQLIDCVCLCVSSRFWLCYLWKRRRGGESVWDPLPWDQQQNGLSRKTFPKMSHYFTITTHSLPNIFLNFQVECKKAQPKEVMTPTGSARGRSRVMPYGMDAFMLGIGMLGKSQPSVEQNVYIRTIYCKHQTCQVSLIRIRHVHTLSSCFWLVIQTAESLNQTWWRLF